MRSARTAVLAALTTLLGGALAVSAPATGATGASGVDSAPAATTVAEQERVTGYWTTARMRAALPAKAPSAAGADTAAVERGEPTRVPKAKPGGTVTDPQVVRTTGKVFFTLGGTNYVCSGAATSSSNRSVVTTAGHCVNEGPGAYATNWAFVPAYDNGARPYGTWTARTLVTTAAWAQQGDINYDGGFAVMNPLNGQSLTDVVGGQAIAFNQARGLSYNAYGYPAAGKFNGQTLQSCSGTATNDPYGTQSQGIPCDMTGGSSGGPWLVSGTHTINSVNSFGYRSVRNVMFGPYFGSAIQSAYSTASSS